MEKKKSVDEVVAEIIEKFENYKSYFSENKVDIDKDIDFWNKVFDKLRDKGYKFSANNSIGGHMFVYM